MGDPKPNMIDAGQRVIVLAFDLLGAEIPKLPGQGVEALLSAPVQDSIKKTLLDYANIKSTSGTTVISGDEAKKLVDSLVTGVKDAASQEMINKVKATPEYKKLEASLQTFQKAAESTTLGVWVNKNKKILYVVGVGLVVGTAAALYITKTGGPLVNKAADPLLGKEFEILQIGTFQIKAGLWEFKPDARVLGARISASGDLGEKVKLELKFGVLAEGVKVQQVEGAAAVKSGPISLSVTGSAKPITQQVNLGLTFGYQSDKFNLGLGAMYQDNTLSGTASAEYKTKSATFGLQGNVGEQKGGGLAYGGLLTVKIPF